MSQIEKIKQLAPTVNSQAVNQLSELVTKYNDVATKYKTLRSNFKSTSEQLAMKTTECQTLEEHLASAKATIEQLQKEIAGYQSMLSFAVTDAIESDIDEEEDDVIVTPTPVQAPVQASKPAPVVAAPAQKQEQILVEIGSDEESEASESEDKEESASESEDEEEEKPAVRPVVAKPNPAAKVPVRPPVARGTAKK